MRGGPVGPALPSWKMEEPPLAASGSAALRFLWTDPCPPVPAQEPQPALPCCLHSPILGKEFRDVHGTVCRQVAICGCLPGPRGQHHPQRSSPPCSPRGPSQKCRGNPATLCVDKFPFSRSQSTGWAPEVTSTRPVSRAGRASWPEHTNSASGEERRLVALCGPTGECRLAERGPRPLLPVLPVLLKAQHCGSKPV